MDLQILNEGLDSRILELEAQRYLSAKILDTVNQSDEKIDIIKRILSLIKNYADCDAVGIRSIQGNDFPYFVTEGFSEDFIKAEKYLRIRDQNGGARKNEEGNPHLECMCGNVLCGRVSSELPFFTEGGSFWTNSTTDILSSTTEKCHRLFTRNLCYREGYESVALIPLSDSDDIIGLLQLNSYQKDKFSEEKINYFEKIGSSIGAGLRGKSAVEAIDKDNEKPEPKLKERPPEIMDSIIPGQQKIQEHQQIKKSIRESKKLYRSLILKMGNGFTLNEIQIDDNRKPVDSYFIEVNPAFEEMTGLDKKDIVGRRVSDVFPGTESFWINKCGQVALSGKTVQFKNGSKLFNQHFEIIAYSPIRGKVATVFTDITERIEIQAALRESENNFRAIAENANDGILAATGEGSYVYANSRAGEITEYSLDELKNMSYKDLIHPDQLDRVGQIYRNRIAGNPVPDCYETEMIKKSGDIIPVEVTGSTTVWHGQPAVMIIIRDIGTRKQLEAAMEKINSELEERVKQRTQELVAVTDKLEEKQKELCRHKLDLEKSNKELVQTNTALTVLARNIDKKRDEVEKKIARAIGSQILPLVEEINNDKLYEKTRAKLDVLSAYLNDLTPQACRVHDIIVSLSPMELRVTMMIKNGFSSEGIARLLNISPHTVKTHRRSIRKKLNIKNSSINLASYLKLKLGKTSNGSNLHI